MARVDATAAERVKRDRQRKLDSGYRRISSLWLNPEAANALEQMEKQGKSATQIINELLAAVDQNARQAPSF